MFSLPDTCAIKKGQFSDAQFVAILQQQANGQTVAQIAREHGLGEATFYTWKSKYAGASVKTNNGPDFVSYQLSKYIEHQLLVRKHTLLGRPTQPTSSD